MPTITSSSLAPVEPSAAVRAAVEVACDRIAPTWPLDRFIAVNPYWGWRASRIADAAASLGVLAGTSLTMPRQWFREQVAAGELDPAVIDEVAAEAGDLAVAELARGVLAGHDDAAPLARVALVADLCDRVGAPTPGVTWPDHVAHQIGQHMAGWADDWQATWAPAESTGLFAAWRLDPTAPRAAGVRAGADLAAEWLAELPSDPTMAVASMAAALGIADDGLEHYCTALLLSVNGWASWCAYLRWQARLDGADDHTIVDLLALRMAWDWLLARDLELVSPADRATLAAWADGWSHVGPMVEACAERRRIDWVLQGALERTYQRRLAAGLQAAPTAPTAPAAPSPDAPRAQAVFCIDVRSEVFRRSLETVAPDVHTKGFAGFFGVPIDYTPAGTEATRPQLPGLLAPALHAVDVREGMSPADAARERRSLTPQQAWSTFSHSPASVFAMVESTGARHMIDLVRGSLPSTRTTPKWEYDGLTDIDRVRPHLTLIDDDPAAAAGLAQRVLTNMGLTAGFAPLVLLCGHGSTTANNPHAAGLDCGACGGQAGDVNARVLANLLNEPAVRDHLVGLGVHIPAGTWFVAGLHDTTVDSITLFDTDLVPAAMQPAVAALQASLQAAGRLARAERAPRLDLDEHAADAERLEREIRHRSTDWAQVRPEWGLAGNAAFIVAPRARTKHLHLQGRTFLHDYDWQADSDLSVLTLVMTAPMLVTNWINMQYHASTVDNRRYGSGNKVLHNVVGGGIGVFEGNGGDLRIGLSVQSLHDGTRLQHQPLRLSVFIEAPREHIDRVLAEHEVVQHVVHNGWLSLWRIDPATGRVERRATTGWAELVDA